MEHQIISRAQAMADGLAFYFTGNPCKHGHLSQRRVTNSDCIECSAIRSREHAKANPDMRRKWDAKYEKKNPDMRKQISRRYYANNKEKMVERSRAYYAENLNKIRQYYEANKDKFFAHSRTRRSRVANAPGTHTAADVRDILTMQRHHCACCGVKLATYHVDHIVPLSRGGSNDKANLQILCAPCNLSKHAKDPLTFMQERGFLL